jgi:hypothetical protein
MKIYITLDYELFFGEPSGGVDECIITPTQKLLQIIEPYNIKLVVFVDVGHLAKLKEYKGTYPSLKDDYEKIVTQIEYLAHNGHSIDLHIHPHWENSTYNGEDWVFDLSQYKLSDFSKKEASDIISKYTKILTSISGIKPKSYRAGGWSAQPFSHIKQGLESVGILIDSTTYPGGFHKSNHQDYDFRSVNQYNTHYRFEDDLTKKQPSGRFTEFPISSYKVNPFFFWKFAYHKIKKSDKHKSYGNGQAISKPKKDIIRLMLRPSNSVVSIDGFKASLIEKAFKKYVRNTNNNGHFVLIGHPKAFTPYSLEKTNAFIEKVKEHHTFSIFE